MRNWNQNYSPSVSIELTITHCCCTLHQILDNSVSVLRRLFGGMSAISYNGAWLRSALETRFIENVPFALEALRGH
jgi:hypothetical protein